MDHEALAYRANRIEQGMLAAVAGLGIEFGHDHVRDDLTMNTMIVGHITVYENTVGVWSGRAEKMGRDKRAVYGKPDGDFSNYSDYIFWQMGCSEIVEILNGLPAETTRQVFPQVAHLRGYELAQELRRLVLASSRPRRLLRLVGRWWSVRMRRPAAFPSRKR